MAGKECASRWSIVGCFDTGVRNDEGVLADGDGSCECVFTLLRSESLKPAGRDGILSDE